MRTIVLKDMRTIMLMLGAHHENDRAQGSPIISFYFFLYNYGSPGTGLASMRQAILCLATFSTSWQSGA
jgi:hypothetical protein